MKMIIEFDEADLHTVTQAHDIVSGFLSRKGIKSTMCTAMSSHFVITQHIEEKNESKN